MKVWFLLLFAMGVVLGFLFFNQPPKVDYVKTADLIHIITEELKKQGHFTEDAPLLISKMCRRAFNPAECREEVFSELKHRLYNDKNLTDYN